MKELENVFTTYIQTKASNALVPGENKTSALAAVRTDIPDFFKVCLQSFGYSSDDLYTKGSVGQPNRSFAKVPWVAIFKKSITTSAQDGYYIVLLFSEDMSSAYLSLNQGYTAFKNRYHSNKLAYEKLRDCAREANAELAMSPSGFIKGPIDLRTDGELAGGYQAGSILAKRYVAGEDLSPDQFAKDVHTLLQAYSILWNRYPQSLVDMDITLSNDEFNDVIEEKLNEAQKTPATSGPQPLPSKGRSVGKEKYMRSPDVSARAIAMADATCVLSTREEQHRTFISAKTSKSYVEAHHLIPFSYQDYFKNSLDVEENIVALCATCHRLLHHARGEEKQKKLLQLWQSRRDALVIRGLELTFPELKKMYRVLSEDD